MHELYHFQAQHGTERMLAESLLEKDAYNPVFIMAWVVWADDYKDDYYLGGMHNKGLRYMDDGEEMFREAFLVLFDERLSWGRYADEAWRTVLHEGAHHGGLSHSDPVAEMTSISSRTASSATRRPRTPSWRSWRRRGPSSRSRMLG